MPLSDGLLREDQLNEEEAFYPLEVAFCPNCSLVQILETVPPEALFGEDYPYYSSYSDALLRHSRRNALDLIARRRLDARSFVVEIASNDGYLLRNFVERGIPVLGIDPAAGPVQAARQIGVPTLCAFFGKDLAANLRSEGRQADVLIANNVLAHVADTNGFVEGIRILLKDDGIAVIEVPYVRDMIDHCEFDTIYHEHLCYFSVTALDGLFRRHGLYLNAIERLPIHGGSLRLHVAKQQAVDASVRGLLMEEAASGTDQYTYFEAFSLRVQALRERLRRQLSDLKRDRQRIAAYGAAAKGTILLNYIGVGREIIDFVVDRNVHKHGKYMPGVHVPVCEPGRLLREMPDYVLLLTWNFRDEILSQQDAYRRGGGRFIVPIPSPEIV